jgi:hypothetical protein
MKHGKLTSVRTEAAGNAPSFLAGKNRRTSTEEKSLAKAKNVAEDWYLPLRGKLGSHDAGQWNKLLC